MDPAKPPMAMSNRPGQWRTTHLVPLNFPWVNQELPRQRLSPLFKIQQLKESRQRSDHQSKSSEEKAVYTVAV